MNSFIFNCTEDNILGINDSHILEFNKDNFKSMMYFECILSNNSITVNFCYSDTHVIRHNLVECTIDNFRKSKYDIMTNNFENFLTKYRLHLDHKKIIDKLSELDDKLSDVYNNILINTKNTSLVRNIMLNFYDIKGGDMI